MKHVKNYAPLLLLFLLIIGCEPQQEIQPTEALLGTQVAVILTETARHEIPPATKTEAPAPSITIIEPTNTATEAPTASPTTTQTAEPSDPAAILGSPAWTYDFSGASSLWDYSSEEAVFETSNGYLQMTALSNPNWHSWWVSTPKLKNAYVEIMMEMGACSGFDRFGFAVRGSSDGEQFYFVDVTCDGRTGFFRMTPGVEIVTVKPYQEVDLLKEGWTDPHRIGIWMEGANFRFFIDGEEVGTANDDELNEGYTGFMIAYAETSEFTVRVDQMQYWNIP